MGLAYSPRTDKDIMLDAFFIDPAFQLLENVIEHFLSTHGGLHHTIDRRDTRPE
jgi:uncharacterized protein YyaL (SSP411 family)